MRWWSGRCLASAQTQNGGQGLIDAPEFFATQVARELTKSLLVDRSDLLDENARGFAGALPGEHATVLHLTGAGQRLRASTSISHLGPGARESRASAVRSVVPIASASATYAAS